MVDGKGAMAHDVSSDGDVGQLIMWRGTPVEGTAGASAPVEVAGRGGADRAAMVAAGADKGGCAWEPTREDLAAARSVCMVAIWLVRAARFCEKWRRDWVSCSLVMVGRAVAAAGVAGGSAAVVVLDVLMVAGGSEEADTKLVGFLLLPGTSLSLYGCLLRGGR